MNILDKIFSVLEKAYPALNSLRDDYFIIGSSALILSGIKIENTHDIDILVSNEDADYLKTAWKAGMLKNHITQDNDLFRSYFSRYNFEELDIEIMGNLKVNRNGAWNPLVIRDFITVNRNEMFFKIPTIQEQLRILELFGRKKDLDKIEFIRNNINL